MAQNLLFFLKKNKGFRGLLDIYGGAAAAYSLRNLSKSWQTQNVILARRSSDNAELGFTANEITNGTLTTWAGAGDAFVKTWYDQSGNAKDATQATAGNQPKIVDTGALNLNSNGNVSLWFNNTTTYLSATSVASAFTGLSKPMSSFQVTEINGTGNQATFSFGNSASSVQFMEPIFSDGSFYEYFYRDDASAIKSGSNISSYSGTDLLTTISNGTVLDVLVDGLNIVTSADITLGTFTLDRFTIGALGRDNLINFLGGNISEFIIYASDQDATRSAIEANINAAYSIF